MSDKDCIATVCDYLKKVFPGCAIRVDEEPGHSGRSFQVDHRGSTYTAVILDEFFNSYDPSTLVSKLEDFTLAEHMRHLPGTPVFVTRTGLRLEYE